MPGSRLRNLLERLKGELQNFEDILRLPPEPRPERPVAVGMLETMRFDDVWFQHQSASSPALSGISFQVSRGETVAFVGPSGAGKTTLVKLLVGLYRPKTGHIYYNGTAEDEVDIEGLRERIGFVTQDAQLFSGSIRENLRLVRPDATDDECLQVLRQASVQSLLARADRGLDTLIGEGGVKVSGGEKQRLSIARALLRQPQLLVFDEATSSLDSLTEEEISQTIRDLGASRDAITILIAHRLSTVMHADRIYVLERGGIVEFGRHTELLRLHFGFAGGELIGRGEVAPTGSGSYAEGPVFWEVCVGAAEVEVDPETGFVNVRRTATAADVGRAINPQLVERQDEGATLQGIGNALFEELVYEDGLLLNDTLLDYRVPSFEDLPDEMTCVIVENEDGPGPYGAKGCGEGALAAVPAAIVNALADAGVPMSELPLTPERVWRRIQELEKEGKWEK